MMTRFQAAWKAFQLPTLIQSRGVNSQKWYNYDLNYLFQGSGTHDRQLQRNVWGATIAYQTVPEVKAALDVIADEAAVVPIVIKDKQGNIIARSDENPEESPLLRAIQDSQKHTGDPLMSLIAYSLKLSGMAFVQIVENNFGYAKGLRWLNPAAIQIDCPRGIIEGYRYSAQGGEYQYLKPSEVIRLRDFNPADDIYGYGTTMNVMGKANAVLNFDRMKVAYYRNGGQPGAIVSFKEPVDLEEAEKLGEFWRRTHRGVDEWFKTQISHIPLDIGNLESMDISKPLQVTIEDGNAILKGFRVAPEMIGDSTNNPYQYSPEKRYAFMQSVEQPITNKVAWSFNQQITPLMEQEGHQLFFDYDAFTVVTETEKAAQDMLHQDWLNGRITFNEYRQGNNYDPVVGGNFYLLPTGKVAVPVTIVDGKPTLPDVSELMTQASQPPALPSPALPEVTGEPIAGLLTQRKYDPDQPRDEDGQFSESGGGSSGGGDGGSDKPTAPKNPLPKPKPKKPKPDKPKNPDSPTPEGVSDIKPDWARGTDRNAAMSDGYLDMGHIEDNPVNGTGNMAEKQIASEHARNLSPRQQEATQTYTGDAYVDINKGLRRGEIPDDYADTIADMDEAIAANSLSQNTVLYRGVKMNDDLRARMTPGATFSDAAYTSTSFDQTNANRFSGATGSAVMRIKAPAGTNGVAVSGISDYPQEREFLLPRNTSYRITGVSRDNAGKLYIDAEIIGSDGKRKSVRFYLPTGKQADNPPSEQDENDRSDRFNWNGDDIVFDDPDTDDSEDDSEPPSQDDKSSRSFWNADDPQSDDLRKWQTVAVKRYKSGNVADALSFESDVLPPVLLSSIRGALQAVSTPDQIYTIFDDAVRYLAHA